MTLQNRLSPKAHTGIYWMPGLLFVFSITFYFLFMVDTPDNGDTYIYARSILTFEGPIIHIGYYSLAFICHKLLKPFGITPLQTLSLISVICGSLSVVGMYVFSLKLTGNRLQSFLSAIILMFAGGFCLYSIHGEVYVPQFFFVLFSALLILKKRIWLSSLFILIAISITPTSYLAIPPLIYLIHITSPEKRQIIHFLLPIVMTTLFLVLWKFSTIIRIVYFAVYTPKIFLKNFSYGALFTEVFYRICKTYGTSFNLICFMAIFGFFAMYQREDKKCLWLMIAFLLPFSLYFFNLDLFSGDHLIISFIPISFLASYGIIQLLKVKNTLSFNKYIIIFLIIIPHFLISCGLFLFPAKRNAKELSRVISKFAREYNDEGAMIAHFKFGMPFWYQTNQKDDFLILWRQKQNFLRKYSKSKPSFEKLEGPLWILTESLIDYYQDQIFIKNMTKKPLYFVDQLYWPSWIVKMIFSDETLEERKRKSTKVNRFKTYLEKSINEKFKIIRIIDSPMYAVYLLQKI